MLDINYHRLMPSPDEAASQVDASQWNAVLRSAAGYHAFRRAYPSGMEPAKVAGFLLFDPGFPRSIAVCVRARWTSCFAAWLPCLNCAAPGDHERP